MDRNELVTATRAEFIRAFQSVLDEIIEHSQERLFSKAEFAASSREQSCFLDARTILMQGTVRLRVQLLRSMEQLLNRSFQTAYSTFRPSFLDAVGQAGLSLVDVNTFEDELRIDEITQTFRNEVPEQLRDLNIRIALLFEQQDIKERENPFRPYIFSKCLASGVEIFELPVDVAGALHEALAEGLRGHIPEIYNRLNDLLAKHGIAAQLSLKIRKAPAPRTAYKSPNPLDPAPEQAAAEAQGSLDQGGVGEGGMSGLYGNPGQGMMNMPSGMQAGMPDGTPAGGAPGAPQLPMEAAWQAGGAAMQAAAMGLNALVGALEALPPGGSVGQAVQGSAPENHAQQRVDQLLQHVQAASHAQLGAESVPSLAPASAPASAEGGSIQKAWLAGSQVVGDVLRRFFTTGSADESVTTARVGAAPQIDTALPQGDAAAASAVHSVVNFARNSIPGVDEMWHEDGTIRNLILENRVELSSVSRDMNEQMVIDVVAMLFEFILRDGNVPSEVRAQLGRLQFFVLKIALQDPELFTHKNHPARLLVNRIGSVSVGLQQVDPSGERIAAEISRIVEALLDDASDGLSVFSRMLDEFDVFIARELRAVDTHVERAVKVLENAESRTLQYARTTAMIGEALTGLTIDPYLHRFIVNTWAHVIERAGRTDEAAAKGYRELVPALIWSIAPKVYPDDRTQLLQMLPGMLAMLNRGLVISGLGAQQKQALLDWLAESHTYALRASSAPAPVPPLSVIEARFAQFVMSTDTHEASAVELVKRVRRSLDPDLLSEAIHEMEAELNLLDQMFDFGPDETDDLGEDAPDAQAAPADEEGDAPALEANSEDWIEGLPVALQSGVAIEINLGGQPTRARLNWISPNASNLVLSMDEDRKPSIITVRLFRRLLGNGRAKFVETAPLFERAIQALLQSADAVER